MNTYVEWGALANVVIFGVIIGAGLPALYAVGVRMLGMAHARADRTAVGYRVAAYACFGVVVLAILAALAFIAAGGH